MKNKKFPVLMPVLAVVGTLILVLSLSIIIRVGVNHSFISDYRRGVYAADKEEKLLVLNVPESYLPYYNMGNVAFKNGDYNSAIAYYTQALSLKPTGKRECQVRINLALAMVYSIDLYHLDSQDKIDTALIILYKARDILMENGWAADDPAQARDATAQQLKEDIDRLIEQLENPEGGGSGDSKDDQNNSGNSDDNNNQQPSGGKEDKHKDELRRQQKGALDEKSREQEDLDKSYDGRKYNGKYSDDEGQGSDSGYSNPW